MRLNYISPEMGLMEETRKNLKKMEAALPLHCKNKKAA